VQKLERSASFFIPVGCEGLDSSDLSFKHVMKVTQYLLSISRIYLAVQAWNELFSFDYLNNHSLGSDYNHPDYSPGYKETSN
jgi:hypothetical protein